MGGQYRIHKGGLWPQAGCIGCNRITIVVDNESGGIGVVMMELINKRPTTGNNIIYSVLCAKCNRGFSTVFSSFFGEDLDNTITTLCTIKGTTSGTFNNFHTVDITQVKGIKVVHLDSIQQNQGIRTAE